MLVSHLVGWGFLVEAIGLSFYFAVKVKVREWVMTVLLAWMLVSVAVAGLALLAVT